MHKHFFIGGRKANGWAVANPFSWENSHRPIANPVRRGGHFSFSPFTMLVWFCMLVLIQSIRWCSFFFLNVIFSIMTLFTWLMEECFIFDYLWRKMNTRHDVLLPSQYCICFDEQVKAYYGAVCRFLYQYLWCYYFSTFHSQVLICMNSCSDRKENSTSKDFHSHKQVWRSRPSSSRSIIKSHCRNLMVPKKWKTTNTWQTKKCYIQNKFLQIVNLK